MAGERNWSRQRQPQSRPSATSLSTRASAGRSADAGNARARALLRRVRRHAARSACPVRQPHQQGVGPGAAQAILPAVQLRAAGGGHRRCGACCRSGRSTRFRCPTSSAISIRPRPRTCWFRRLLDAPVFQTRWRWNTTIALAVPRSRAGRKVPPPLQRMLADDLLAAVFPDAAACLENIPGRSATSRSPARHSGCPRLPRRGHGCRRSQEDFDSHSPGDLRLVTCDTPEPSPISHEILNARPYAFLDDAPLEERRAQAVYTRRASEPASAHDLGTLDFAGDRRVRDEEKPDPRDADELHDALLTVGYLSSAESEALPASLFSELVGSGRAAQIALPAGMVWVAAERLTEMSAVHPAVPTPTTPSNRTSRQWTREQAVVELFRSRLSFIGPTTSSELAASLAIPGLTQPRRSSSLKLKALYYADASAAQASWSGAIVDSLLASIGTRSIGCVRKSSPSAPWTFNDFCLPGSALIPLGVLPASTVSGLFCRRWTVSSCRQKPGSERFCRRGLDRYDRSWLDILSLTGEIGWARLSKTTESSAGNNGSLRVAVFLREHADAWHALRFCDAADAALVERSISTGAREVLDLLRTRGASFLPELVRTGAGDEPAIRSAVASLAATGLVTSDGFAGVRASCRRCAGTPQQIDVTTARDDGFQCQSTSPPQSREAAVETQARGLLARYGVVFRRLCQRETNPAPWRELAAVYRRLEARGEIRGGRFVSGMSGEQFALPEAVERLREVRKSKRDGLLITISAVDPLNLNGIVTSGERIRSISSNRMVYRDGMALAVLEGDYIRPLAEIDPAVADGLATALAGRRRPAVTSGFVGR